MGRPEGLLGGGMTVAGGEKTVAMVAALHGDRETELSGEIGRGCSGTRGDAVQSMKNSPKKKIER